MHKTQRHSTPTETHFTRHPKIRREFFKLYGKSLLAMTATFLGEMVGSKMGSIVTWMESPCSWRNISLSSKINVSSTGPSAARIDQ